MYDPAMVQPMRDELTTQGVTELKDGPAVKEAMAKKEGSQVVLVNSVCGCAAGSARPGFIASLQSDNKPDDIYTVFAGVDSEAVAAARSYFVGYQPSSPAIGLFRDGELVHMIERHQIEGSDAGTISKILSSAYDKFCGESIDENAQIFDPESAMEISVEDTKAAMDDGSAMIYDIRPEEEAQLGSIPGVKILNQQLAEEIVNTVPKDQLLVFHCHHGVRSRQAVKYFAQYGFSNCKSMAGGIQAWSERIDASVPTYQ
jgi:putative YphP/YqiW family bacilliredoxin